MIDAVILSDTHLGAPSCQTDLLEDLLHNLPPTDCLALNGDILDSTEVRLTKKHWRVLSRIRKLSASMRVVWIRGNHDHDAEAVAHLVGAEFVDEFVFFSGGKKILCVHGDMWDSFITDYPRITAFADVIYLWLQRRSRRLAVRAKRRSKTFLRSVEKVQAGAIEYMKFRRADMVCCGHTHMPRMPYTELRDVYANSGSWTDDVSTYLVVENGIVTLCDKTSKTPTLVEAS